MLFVLALAGSLFHSSAFSEFSDKPVVKFEFIFGIIVGVLYQKVRNSERLHGIPLRVFKIIAVITLVGGAFLMATTIFTGINNMYIVEYLTKDNSLALTRIDLGRSKRPPGFGGIVL